MPCTFIKICTKIIASTIKEKNMTVDLLEKRPKRWKAK